LKNGDAFVPATSQQFGAISQTTHSLAGVSGVSNDLDHMDVTEQVRFPTVSGRLVACSEAFKLTLMV
jgi:hypothetical protein